MTGDHAMLKILAPAKINLCLEILGKREDGYHEIDTVMQAISLFDEITLEDAPELTLECTQDLGRIEDNLVWRAAELMRDTCAPNKGARIRLHKRIPHGAGLGGGSSDAANTLVALNRLWETGLEPPELCELAAQIGSDCAFFVEGGTSRCTGRGEEIEALPDLEGLDFVVLYPNAVCSTPAVYAELSRGLTKGSTDCYLFHEYESAIFREKLAQSMQNRLQEPALRVSARLREVWSETENESGVLKRLVSGSGSSIVFLTADESKARSLTEALILRRLGQVFCVKSLPRGTVWG
jgi:4-diphosphocytidyl-2-C-methyl-D-erythritol kinase